MQEDLLYLTGPDGCQASWKLVSRKSLTPRDVHALPSLHDRPVLMMAPFVSERARTLLRASQISYADQTGHLHLVASQPAIFLEGVGAVRDPDPPSRALQSLKGAAAGRVVRALAEVEIPLGVRSLAAASCSPLGTVSRVVSFLQEESILERDEQRQIVSVDRIALLQRWSRDYALTRSNHVHRYLEPRGLPSLWRRLSCLTRYALTGSPAGPGVAATRIAMVYVDDPEAAAQSLGLLPAEAGANVWLLSPFDPVVFERSRLRELPGPDGPVSVITVSEAQAFVDLASSPGRGPAEAEVLMQNMR